MLSEKHSSAVGRCSVVEERPRAVVTEMLLAVRELHDNGPDPACLEGVEPAQHPMLVTCPTAAATGSLTRPCGPVKLDGEDADSPMAELDDVLGGCPRAGAVVDVDARVAVGRRRGR